MKLNLTFSAAMLGGACVLSACAVAQEAAAGRHPAYLHALSDMRAARADLDHHRGDEAARMQEERAVIEIDAAMGDTKRAARDDGRNLHDLPPVDEAMGVPGRLRHSVELLRQAHLDLAHSEGNPEARGFKDEALRHLDRAILAADQALHDAERRR